MIDAVRQSELDEWVLGTAPRALAFAISLLHDRDKAEDIVQDCYCRLLEKADVYDLPRDGAKLLFRSITNASINLTSRRKSMISLDTAGPDPEEGGIQVADRSAQEPEVIAMTHELEQAVAKGLEHLPEMHRAALELKSLGQTQQEIADILEISATYAGVLIHRARQMMADYLAPFVGEAMG